MPKGEAIAAGRLTSLHKAVKHNISAAALPGSAPMHLLGTEACGPVPPVGAAFISWLLLLPGRTVLHASVFRRHVGEEPEGAGAEMACLTTECNVGSHGFLVQPLLSSAPVCFLFLGDIEPEC